MAVMKEEKDVRGYGNCELPFVLVSADITIEFRVGDSIDTKINLSLSHGYRQQGRKTWFLLWFTSPDILSRIWTRLAQRSYCD
jgi:hypothetical protein